MSAQTSRQDGGERKRVFLFSYPRTASHLLMRMLGLETQPACASHPAADQEYFFHAAVGVQLKLAKIRQEQHGLTGDDKASVMNIYQSCASNMEAFLNTAEAQGRSVFIKEHVTFMKVPISHGDENGDKSWTVNICGHSADQPKENPTLLPDNFLLDFNPTFMIRHPALAFPSLYRNFKSSEFAQEVFGGYQTAMYTAVISIRPVRNLYDWYRSQYEAQGQQAGTEQADVNIRPIVLDANEIIRHPEVVQKYSSLIGLDVSQLISEWDAYTAEQCAKLPNDLAHNMVATITSSTGVIKDKAPVEVDVEVEAAKWREEFGKEAGSIIEQAVMEAMPDYQYLASKRLRPN